MDNSLINIAEGNKFVLTLDALDLSLLTSIYQPRLRENSVVLWSNIKDITEDNGYFEFEIKSRYDTDDDTQEKTHTTCYICNTVVPNAYVFQHLNSSKHIAYQKITETAIERARKHKKLTGVEQINNSSEYFCDHCVTTIYYSNKNEHEKSRTHMHFVALDAFLNNFALFYCNNEIGEVIEAPTDKNGDISNIDVSILKVHNKLSKKHNIEQEIEFDVIQLKNNEKNDADLDKGNSALEIKLKESVALISDIESCLEAPHEENNNNSTNDNEHTAADIVNNLEQYIKRLKKHGTAKLHTVDAYNQDCLRIATLSGSELVVTTFNFHGYKKMGKFLECRLCKTIVKDANDHRLSEKHMQLVSQQFQDKHCIRQLESPWSHCVVCNAIIDNVMVHTNFNNHIKKVEQALIEQTPTPRPINIEQVEENIIHDDTLNPNKRDDMNSTNICISTQPEALETGNNNAENTNQTLSFLNANPIQSLSESQSYCVVCHTQMHVNNVDRHLLGPKHCQNFKVRLYYLMNKVKNELNCKVCYTKVSPYTWAVKDHIASTTHINNYNNFLATHKIDITKIGFFCQICMQKLVIMDEISHTETISHRIKLACYNINCVDINLNNIKDLDQEYVDDSVDTENVSTKLIEEEVQQNTEKSNGNTEENDSNNMTSTEFDYKAKLSCERTQSNVSNETNQVDNSPHECQDFNVDQSANSHDSNLKIHKENSKHQTMDVLLTGVNNLLEELLKCFNTPLKIHSHLQRTDFINELRCKVCTDTVTIEDTEKHINSLKHIRKHRDLMMANKLKWKSDIYVCYVCNVYIDLGKELRHVETVEHKRRMELLKNGDYVLISADDRKLIDKIQRELNVIEPKNDVLELEEITFDDFIPRNYGLITEEDVHVRHHFCKIIDNENKLICVLCQELVENTKQDIQRHTNHVYHKEKYKLTMTFNQIYEIDKGFVCGYCESVGDQNEIKHIANETHIANQKKDPRKNFCFTCNVSMIDVGMKEHLTSQAHIKRVDTPARFYCNICDIQIKNNEANIQRHNEGFEHKNNDIMIIENKIILKNKKCVCQVCETGFSRESLHDHIGTLNHSLLLHCMSITPDQCQ